MPIDSYSPCPGGTGKKIKFCCSDLTGELEKIQRMLEGEQRAACLDHIESLEAKFPERACLLSIKSMLQLQLGQEAQAQATVETFIQRYPDNPVALAEQATLAVGKEGAVAAVALLQSALEKSSEQMSHQVYEAIGLVAQSLVLENHLVAARAHLMLQLGLSGSQDEQPLQMLLRLNGSPSLPLWAKQDLPLVPPPDDALWKNSFNAALEPALRGAWRQSAVLLVDLAGSIGDWPAIWHNVAVLRTWLADTPGAVAAWRKYAAQPIPLEDAVEAEALAQALDAEAVDLVDVLSIDYGVADVETLQARLAASPQALAMPIDLSQLAAEDQPPPKGAYWLLDRAVPDDGRTIAREAVPRVVGEVFVFGKQTDRDARLQLVAYRTQLVESRGTLAAVCGDAIGAAGDEAVRSQVPALQHALAINWHLPADTPPERRADLIREQRREMLLKGWPEMPRKIFGGKTARQVAGDASERIKLLAAILLLELASDQVAAEFDFNELRRELGCPEQATIDPRQVKAAELPLVRLGHVDVKQLADQDLVEIYRRASHYRLVAALRKLGHEVIARPSLEGQIDKAAVYGSLAQVESDGGQALAYLNEARKAAEAAGKSTAPWDLSELALRISRGEVAEADQLLHHIREQHIREPGVAQTLFQILADAGIIGPDGKPTAAPAASQEAPGLVVPGAPATEAGKIWTPGAAEPTGGKKSSIWTPGD